MPKCCCLCCVCRFGLSTFGWCCCCCTVPKSNDQLPLLDVERKMPITYESLTINEIYISESYLSLKNKSCLTKSRIRIVTTSDTHMHHTNMRMPSGDILIIAGDFTNWKTTKENQQSVLKWLSTLNQYKYKIIISGNHEVGINENNPNETKELFLKYGGNTIYLQDDEFEAFGLKFYGTPWHPKRGCLFHAEAFAKPISKLNKIFNNIPNDTDILITHVPPYGIRDNETAGHIGSDSLLYNSRDRVKPIMHIFGHVHGENGISFVKGSDITFINTATRINVFDLIQSKKQSDDDEYKIEEI